MRILWAITAALAACAPGVAQDWTGPYVGLSGAISANQTVNSFGTITGEFSGSGIGAIAGHRFSAGSFLIGVDANAFLFSAQKVYGGGETFQLRSEGAVRATMGVPLGTYLPYAAAGVAASLGEYEAPAIHSLVGHVGITVAAGLEAALTENLSARVELSHTTYGLGDYGPWFGGSVWVRPVTTKLETGILFRF